MWKMFCVIMIDLYFFKDSTMEKGFCLSQSLPEPQRYVRSLENPILEVIADQVNNDSRFSQHMTGATLRNKIVEGLENGNIVWPDNPNLYTKEEWMNKMHFDLSFYTVHSRDCEEWEMYEDQLFKLLANYLRRKIRIIPFPTGRHIVISPEEKSSKKVYNIMSLRKAMFDNFFISIFEK